MSNIILRGRCFSPDEILVTQDLIAKNWASGRSAISRKICTALNWRQDNGRLKDRACRDVLCILEKKGVVKLPRSKIERRFNRCQRSLKDPTMLPPTSFRKPSEKITICDWSNVSFEMVCGNKRVRLWNYLMQNYHYQGHSVIVGKHLKYLINLNETPIACIGWGEAAWHLKDRDAWIGWTDSARRRNLKRVINNVRFLILPWTRIPNSASAILSRAVKIVARDWNMFYGIKPILLETFIDRERFAGSCYKAANWIHVGITKGFARKGYSYHNNQSLKDIYVYPLCKNASNWLSIQ